MRTLNHSTRTMVVLAIAILIAGCRNDVPEFRESASIRSEAENICSESNNPEHDAASLFPQETSICIADTDFNTMSVSAVVDRTPPSRPSPGTRIALMQKGSMGPYDIATWGLNQASDVTFFSTRQYFDLAPNTRLIVGSPYNGCVAIGNLRVKRRIPPPNSTSCMLQLYVRGRG